MKHYNNRHYHEVLGNLTTEDVYCGKPESILESRKQLKQQVLAKTKRKSNQSLTRKKIKSFLNISGGLFHGG